jgi:spermidine/putrescine transport system ATP-binding protein
VLTPASEPPPPGHCALRGTVTDVVYLGTSTSYRVVTAGGAEMAVYRQNLAALPGAEVTQAQEVWLSWPPDHSYVLER